MTTKANPSVAISQSQPAQGSDRLQRLATALVAARRQLGLVRVGGFVVRASPSHYTVAGLESHVQIGDCVEFDCGTGQAMGQVVRLDADNVTVESFGVSVNLGLGHPVWRRGPLTLAPAPSWKGRIIDALAKPIDGAGPLEEGPQERRSDASPPDPLQRHRVDRPVRTGIKVIDLFTPLCAGQRLGIFAGSGVGKSTLLGMLARSRGFDATVIALVGERGREVREFIDDILGAGMSSAVVVVATGDESPMMRRQAPRTAMTVAEHFRDQGENVLLIVDSITRYAHAMREVALAGGEPPVARGYTPSVFTELPRLLERAGPGATAQGAITGLFSVLVDGDDHNEPIADAVRGILDGHIVLDREVASRGQFPAVDVLRSVSRLADKAWSEEQRSIAKHLKSMIAEFEGTRELRLLGAYKSGTSAELDRAVTLVPRIYEFLGQAPKVVSESDVFQDLAKCVAIGG